MYLAGFLCKVFDIGAPPLNLSLDAPLSNEVDGRSTRDCSRMSPAGYDEMGPLDFLMSYTYSGTVPLSPLPLCATNLGRS